MLKSLTIIGAGLALGVASPAFACADITSKNVKLTACVDEQWAAQAAESGPVEFSYSTADQNFALQVVTEETVLNAQQLHDAILANAATAVGKENVKLIGERVEAIDGKAFNQLEYTLTDGTTTITYQNLYYSAPGFGAVQITALSVPEAATSAAFKLGQFAATVKIGG
ncbi:MAG: hypothetical protein ABI697_10195 [Devosia sp.]